ncbi:MAG: sulfurtransferase TusA family protein [Xanthomonadales bacterium]|nr:sulfurtransferase TusA family protein [Xanthomonadales bacterium]
MSDPNALPPDYARAARVVDARGTLCPEPLLRCRAALAEVDVGESVHLLADDPHAGIDLAVYARRSGNPVLREDERDGVLHLLIRNASGAA